jgi:hypothetical protein
LSTLNLLKSSLADNPKSKIDKYSRIALGRLIALCPYLAGCNPYVLCG